MLLIVPLILAVCIIRWRSGWSWVRCIAAGLGLTLLVFLLLGAGVALVDFLGIADTIE